MVILGRVFLILSNGYFMNNHFSEILLESKNNKKEKRTTVSVRVTPEIGIMLKALSYKKCYDFPISKVFTYSFGSLLAYDILSVFFDKNGDNEELNVSELIDFFNEVVSDDRFIVNNSNKDAITNLLGNVDENTHGVGLTFNNSNRVFVEKEIDFDDFFYTD